MAYQVYLVEDEENLNSILKMYLEKEGYEVKSFLDGKTALEKVCNPPHLWILDIMLPDINGYTLLKKIKEFDSSTPTIFISARNQDLDRVIGLELGSDDYISKPFLPRELVIKTQNLLKLTYEPNCLSYKPFIQLNNYSINYEKHMVTYNNQPIDLSSKEFDLLILMAKNLNHAFSREQILEKVWDDNYYGSDRVVDDTIRRLRKKLPHLSIETIYGFGYRMLNNEG
ncbi:response regulator transcription factor [Inediibacterium massiliense]|uniref:response regulator transcription factor n=1 Tax=Inediibacterium massiliense TaxID=1658111 RepID=UPI0006B5A0F1|nr:response regulator transcription factor [Inediibacterium massiliense]